MNPEETTKAKQMEINLVAKILNHSSEPRFVKLGEKLEALREKHEQGLITSTDNSRTYCQGH